MKIKGAGGEQGKSRRMRGVEEAEGVWQDPPVLIEKGLFG